MGDGSGDGFGFSWAMATATAQNMMATVPRDLIAVGISFMEFPSNGLYAPIKTCVRRNRQSSQLCEDSQGQRTRRFRKGSQRKTFANFCASFAHFAVFCSVSNEALELFMVEC
jgi:hypothetical protein